MTSRREIATYWVHGEGSRRAPLLALRLDMRRPECFGCGVEPSRGDWNEASLDRAHIVSEESGGEDRPDNLVLLCPSCHAEAPMVGDSGTMLRWVTARRPHAEAAANALARELGALDVDIVEAAKRADGVLGAFSAAAADVGAGLHQGRMSASTLAAVVKRAVEMSADRLEERDG